jgi:hypothetical protein
MRGTMTGKILEAHLVEGRSARGSTSSPRERRIVGGGVVNQLSTGRTRSGQ